MIILWILLAIVVIILLYVWGTYNSFVQLKNTFEKTWADIDVKLKQRADEIPKLINTVKGYMKHEKETLENVTKARTAFMNAQGQGEKLAADNMLTGALKSLFAVAENYPDLKANENFMQLQGRITGIENDLSEKRTLFNNATNTYNIRVEMFPSKIVAGMFNFKKKELFQVSEEDKKDVKVEF